MLEGFEAGTALTGSEVKSWGNRQIRLTEMHASLKDGERWLHKIYLIAYRYARNEDSWPERPRKLLMHRRDIDRLEAKGRQKGLTFVPAQIYLSKGRIKCEVALVKGEQAHDKRDANRKVIEASEAQEAASRRHSRNTRSWGRHWSDGPASPAAVRASAGRGYARLGPT